MTPAGAPPPRTSALAIWAADRWIERTGIEFLRIVMALVATGREVFLVEAGRGHGALSGDEISEEGKSYLGALADSGIHPTEIDDASLTHAAGTVDAIVRVGEPDRAAEPGVLVIDGETVDGSTVLVAGQVIVARE